MERTIFGDHAGKIIACALAAALVSLLAIALPGQAYASIVHKNVASAKGTAAIVYEKGWASVDFWWYGAAPTKVKLSNKKVARIVMDEEAGRLEVEAKKPGKTTLTYKFKGKKHKVKIRIYKYRNPVASFKVGGKQYKSRYNKKQIIDFGTKRITLPAGKVKVVPAKNWKLKTIDFTWAGAGKTIKNGGKMPKNAEYMTVTLRNKKTKVEQDLIMCCGMC